jgi:hypothetical protein
VARPGGAAAHPAVVETEQVDSLAQLHDPRLGLLEFELKLAQDRRERREAFSASRLVLHNASSVGVAD